MNILQDYWKPGAKSLIARRFVIATVLCSTILAIFITGIQLYNDYRTDVSLLKDYLQNIEKSRVPSLVQSVWNIDEPLIESQLLGILQLDGVEYIAIVTPDKTTAYGDASKTHNKSIYRYPLEQLESGRHYSLGELTITISYDHIYSRLIHRGTIVLIGNTLKTFLVAAFIIMIYQYMIGQHISRLASFAKDYNPNKPSQHLSLDRNIAQEDELSAVENAINISVDAHKQYIEAQQRINEELNYANEELTQFAYSTSHDLKAPLTSVHGFLTFAEKDVQKGNYEKALECVKRAKNESKRLSDRIEDMLTLAKSELNHNEWEPVDIAEIIDNIWASMQNAYCNIPSELIANFNHSQALMTVSVRIELILENVLSNALKYADSKKGSAKVTVETQECKGNFILSISDNGVGIPEAYHNKVFRVFQRFANSDYPSSGLGLAIVKKNIDQLGGDVRFNSTPEGTTFIITLPQNKIPYSQRV